VRALSLLYHDVIADGDWEASGFPGRAAASYKLDRRDFARHVTAISAVAARRDTVHHVQQGDVAPVLLTFDDGGASAYDCVADLLERAGWHGHFLITTDYLGQPGFVTRSQVRELAGRGHVIGSHSCSHLTGMSARPRAQLVDEWKRSTGELADASGQAVTVASVPFGAFSRRVAAAAAAAGITALFTSEPTAECRWIDGCLVLGRYTVRRDTPAAAAGALAAGALGPRLRQWWLWNLKKTAKAALGDVYLAARHAVFER
jgi:peptidoglycan/xylan/chitin deacetylase (PgdA/CDA1 family)